MAELADILGALDLDEVRAFADVNGGAPELAIALQRRYGCTIDVLAMDARGHFAAPGRTLAAYRQTLLEAGIEPEAVRIVEREADLGRYDVIASIGAFGSRFKIKHARALLERALLPLSRLVIEIRKGSGTYPFLKAYGSCNTLRPPAEGRDGLAVMSAEPEAQAPAGQWRGIARELAAKEGFFTDLGEHSFLHVVRGDTLVVTFDNLDIAMTKRDDRRPWGYGFIESEGWSMLGVMANGWTWFRDPAVFAEFDRLSASGFFKQFRRVVFYGASMGAYGAAAFSAAAPGSVVFAISPQSTLDKKIVPWEMRYKKAWGRDFGGKYGDAAEASRTAARVHIMYDPHVAADAAHARRFTAPNVVHWRCPLLGHRLGSSLHQMGILGEIARSCINGTLEERQFRRLLRRRRSFPRYQRELAHLALERGHPALALRLCRHVLAQRDDKVLRNMLRRLENAPAPAAAHRPAAQMQR